MSGGKNLNWDKDAALFSEIKERGDACENIQWVKKEVWLLYGEYLDNLAKPFPENLLPKQNERKLK